jgi:hypothetical protein
VSLNWNHEEYWAEQAEVAPGTQLEVPDGTAPWRYGLNEEGTYSIWELERNNYPDGGWGWVKGDVIAVVSSELEAKHILQYFQLAISKAYHFAKAEARAEIEMLQKANTELRREIGLWVQDRDTARAQVARLVEAAQEAIGHIENREPHYVIKPLKAAIDEVQGEG